MVQRKMIPFDGITLFRIFADQTADIAYET